jgi:hypothetical protein
MPEGWIEVFTIPYGDGADTLGTAPGGDGGLELGPEYGAQAPDGTWWFLDAAKLRLAHFAADGSYLDAVTVPDEVLVDGTYFQFQMPRILDDGTLVATGLGSGSTRLLIMRSGVIEGAEIATELVPRVDDGVLLYGFTVGEGASSPVVVDVNEVESAETEWFLARNGDRFRLTVGAGELRIETPDASPPMDRTLSVEAGEVGGPAFFSLESATGEDGTLHLLLVGFTEADESLQLAGYLTVAADGTLSRVEPMRDPFTAADPGSPAHLGVRPGTSDAWLMFVDTDGVRVFRRA